MSNESQERSSVKNRIEFKGESKLRYLAQRTWSQSHLSSQWDKVWLVMEHIPSMDSCLGADRADKPGPIIVTLALLPINTDVLLLPIV